jgi:hypothetical protein
MAGPAYYGAILSIAKNEDWIVPFVYASIGSDGVTTTPINLTGSLLRLQLRKREADHIAVVQVESPDEGITITDVVNGAFTIVIEREDLVNVVAGDYVADFVRQMPNGLIERVFEGTATVVEGTTR